MVRVYAGYARYDTDSELAILPACAMHADREQLMRLVSLKHNYFMPTMKLATKRRNGGRVKKTYTVDTPLNRMLTSSMITKTTKKALQATRDSIDLLKLLSQIQSLQKQLDRAYRLKHTGVAR